MNLSTTLVTQMIMLFTLRQVITKFVWPPLVKALNERVRKITDSLAAADKGKAELELASKRVEQVPTEARGESTQRIAGAEKRAQVSVKEIKQSAQAEAARIITQAKVETEQRIVHARESLRDQVTTLAVKGAEQVLRREVNTQVHTGLLNRLKAEL